MKHAFQIGDEVTWESQSGGFAKRKTGRIVQVVRTGMLPEVGSLRILGAGFGGGREHVSFLVRVGNVAYWPLVSKLRPCR